MPRRMRNAADATIWAFQVPNTTPPSIVTTVPAAQHRELTELTDLHLLILGALWTRQEATIAEIHAAIRHRSDAAPKTIATLLGRLQQRALVSRRTAGRQGVYRALVGRREALVARMGVMLTSFFAAEEKAIGVAAVQQQDVQDGDAEHLLALLRRAERDIEAA